MAREDTAETTEVGRAILSFLLDNPQAQDTLEGIAEWWVTDRLIRREVARVRGALERLVAEGLVVAKPAADGTVRYGLNGRRRAEIQRRLSEETEETR